MQCNVQDTSYALLILPCYISDSYFSHIIAYYSHTFFCINVSGTCWHLEKQELDMYQFWCKYTVEISYTRKMVNESHPGLFLNKLIISHVTICYWFEYQISTSHSFIMPLNVFNYKILSCLWVSYISQNYTCKISHL